MDRAISPEIKKRRKQKRILQIIVISFFTGIGFYSLMYLFQPGIAAKNIRVYSVDKGPLEISVYAVGKIVSQEEQVITSPVSSKILEVYKKAGEKVTKGEALLKLDLETIKTEYETKQEELQMKRNKLELQKATFENQLSEMQMQIAIDEMQLKRSEVMLYNEKYLDSIGASTADKVRQTELDYKVKQMQLEQFKRKFANQQRTSEAEIKSLELDYKIARKNIDLMFKTLGEAQIRAPHSATLTWINDQVGSSVNQGSDVAIISDLTRFKIEAEIADGYADKINSGNRVTVKIGSDKLSGTVSNVTPSVKNGMIKFSVLLAENNHPKLRSGLKVDTYVTHALKEEVLRIGNGSYYIGPGEYDLWIVSEGKAIKKKVILGEGSFEQIEVINGLATGEQVIVSDMSRYQNDKKIRIKN
ncbi:efflux RND transporter periplasmic adaptor subunit [Gabonibacter chumensis]|uniref:efflux RND transporter periplasmic adaptor subunit n=1 Tax=Gabonibacter chumensis TaxID=2972474 RepID=UPI00257393B5|nr:HlyD family efflux transporter periplasmic adaptor subunit [Gabonibacter chumensis]MCR9012186.1 HlyD family efflux transporter periplasmic adaptor subunit [Gabonibacter chumensis]